MEKQESQQPEKKNPNPQRGSYSDDLNKVPHPETLDPQAEKFAGSKLSTEVDLDEDEALDDESTKSSKVDKSKSTQKDNRLL